MLYDIREMIPTEGYTEVDSRALCVSVRLLPFITVLGRAVCCAQQFPCSFICLYHTIWVYILYIFAKGLYAVDNLIIIVLIRRVKRSTTMCQRE